MSNPVTTAWTWSKRHSPLVRAALWLPKRIRPHAQARALLASAGLPDALAARIDTIVRLTRLWSDERADIARELAAHARDALDHDRDPVDVSASLGDPKTVARLFRRSAKRKRHWVWQARRRTLQAIAATLALATLAYALLFTRFNLAEPRITRNFIAELNSRNTPYTDAQHALPAIERLWLAYRREEQRTEPERQAAYTAYRQSPAYINNEVPEPDQWAFEKLAFAQPTDPDYDEYAAWMRSIRPVLDAAQQATTLPTLGALYSDRCDEERIDGDIVIMRPKPPAPDPRNGNTLIDVLLPWLGEARVAAKVLAADAALAASEHDRDRARERLLATLRITDLVSKEPFLISNLVGIAIELHAQSVLLHIVHQHPDLFTENDLTTLCHAVAATHDRARQLDFQGERMMFADALQRGFTDDGTGDGRLTASGVRLIATLANPADLGVVYDMPVNPRTSARLIGPVYELTVGSRAENQTLFDQLLSIAQQAVNSDPKDIALTTPGGEMDRLYKRRVEHSTRFPLLEIMLPSIDRLAASVHTADTRTAAAELVLAAHLHLRRTGSWPASPEDLVPALLPAVPQDPFDPGHALRTLVRDDRLVVYSVGTDGDDDHARPPSDPDDTKEWDLFRRYTPPEALSPDAGPPPDCDWILYPPAD